MRSIEFRVWNKKRTTMSYSNSIFEDNPDGIRHLGSWLDAHFPGALSDATNMEIMQYTGLKDKNGTKIFEGDTVITLWQHDSVTCFDYYLSGTIIYNEEKAGFFLEYFKDQEKWERPLYSFEREELHEIEILGNRFENPKLLEAQNEENI